MMDVWWDFQEWLINRVAGKLLVVTGGIGIIGNIFYDKIVTRPFIEYGFMQRLMFVYCCVLIFVGLVLWNFTKDINEEDKIYES